MTDRRVGDVPSFDDIVKGYDEKWFETKSLIVVVIEDYGNKMPVVREVKKSGVQLIIDVDYLEFTEYLKQTDYSDTEDGQIFNVFIEVDSSDIEKCDGVITVIPHKSAEPFQ